MAWEYILSERIGPVAKVTLNRPEAHNAQNTFLLRELDEALREADADPEVNVIILAGAGRSFSAGHDLKLAVMDPDYAERRKTAEGRFDLEIELFYDKCLAIRNLKKPTIAQVQGNCIAAGLMVAAMCDLIVAGDDAKFSDPVVHRLAVSGVEVLVHPWEVGVRKAKEMLFTGDPIDAHEAHRLGLVNRVVPRADLEEQTLALAQKIAAGPPVAIQMMKRSLNHTLDAMGQREALEYHFMLHQLSHSTAEAGNVMAQRQQAGDLKTFLAQQKGA